MSARRIILAGLVSAFTCAGLVLAGSPVHAQMAAALGKPLPVGDLEVGTVTVRVVAGAPDKPMVGIDVKLVSTSGGERTARTDAEGRATFTRLEPGTRYLARAGEAAASGASAGEEPPQAASEEFTVPPSGGIRMMLSTRPWTEAGESGGSGAPGGAAGAPGGMPDPRQMSGISRPDPTVAAQTLVIAAVQGMVTNKVAGHPIHLVGYAADGSIYKITKVTGADGRATFDGLVPGTVAYYATSAYARGKGEGAVIDRTVSQSVVLPPQVGVRLMLAGPAADSSEAGVDDLVRMETQDVSEPGVVAVRMVGSVNDSMSVELFEVGDQGSAPVRVGAAPVSDPAPINVSGRFGDAVQQAGSADGSVTVSVQVGRRGDPVAGAEIEIIPVTASSAVAAPRGQGSKPGKPAAGQGEPPAGLSRITDASGNVTVAELVAGAQYRAAATVHGVRIESAPFTIPQSGGLRLTVTTTWDVLSNGEAKLSGVEAGKVYFAQITAQGTSFRSGPFLMVANRGAAVRILLYPRLLFSFHLSAEVDDKYLGFRGQIDIRNLSYAPLDPGDAGLLIPLPRGFIGAQVAEEAQMLVKPDPAHGLIWRDAVPPSGMSFQPSSFLAGFSLPVSTEGNVRFDMDLPMGLFKSSVAVLKTPGMKMVDLVPGVRADERMSRTGHPFFVLSDITIMPNQSMSFGITGLPVRPASERMLAYGAGVIALLLLAWTAVGVARHRQVVPAGAGIQTDAASSKKLARRRDELLDRLAELEAKHKRGEIPESAFDRDRDRLLVELKGIYANLDALGDRGSAAS